MIILTGCSIQQVLLKTKLNLVDEYFILTISKYSSYKVHTISLQPFFRVGTFIDCTHMKL